MTNTNCCSYSTSAYLNEGQLSDGFDKVFDAIAAAMFVTLMRDLTISLAL